MGSALIFLFFLLAVKGQSPTITSLPESLFGASGGVHSVVEGSVIQLYCSVEPVNATVSWTKDNVSVIIDVPHLRVRMSSNGTHNTSVLTLDNFRSGDNGMYQCHAMSGGVNESGSTVSLTAFNTTVSGALVLGQQPTDNERTTVNNGATDVPLLRDNRTAVSLGETIDPSSTPDADKLLRCVAGHQNDNMTNFSPSTVVWIKNGETVEDGGDITISTSMAANGEVSSSFQIASFQESNAGVYQCIFTDNSSSDGEIITTIPLRLDTGETLTISRVSPQAIILRPPEKLVIEVETTGRYETILWTRNGIRFSEMMANSFFVRFPNVFPTSSELTNYFEIFVREPTTESDFGVYDVELDTLDPNTQTFTANYGQAAFAVIQAVNANTSAIIGPTVTVLERDSVSISCTSTGVPTPFITWSFNGTAAPFNQTNTVVDFEANILAANQFTVDPGVITSELHIVSASYPDHDGEYTCVGVNSEDAVFTSSSAFITVQVQIVPEVEVTSDAPNNRIIIGGTITLTCSISRGNPTSYTYEWSIVGSNDKITETSSTLTVSVTSVNQLGTYECRVDNSIGTGRGNITIVEGVPPSVTANGPALPVVVDNIVDLVCVVTGDTPLTITWTHDSGGGVTVFTGDDTTGGNFTLTVNSDDYGSYTCNATNLFGSASDTVNVIQAETPILSPDQFVEVVLGDQLMLSTRFTGFNLPLITIAWTRNGEMISSATDRVSIVTMGIGGPNGTSILTVSPVNTPSDGGIYIVTATNPAGSDMTVFTVNITGFPPTPMVLSVISVTSRSVDISWKIDTSTIPISGYMVHVVTATTSQVVFSDNTLSPNALMLTLRDLQPTTDYQFFISSVNTAGTGEQVSTQFRTITDVLLFQLRLQLTGTGRSCNDWVSVDHANLNQATDGVANAIVTNVEERCQCEFTRSNITAEGFLCFPASVNTVTYRGEIHETDSASVFDLIKHIEDWTAGEVLIRVQRVFIKVDGSCRVAIESLNEDECLLRSTITATTILSSTSATSISTSTTESETESPQTAPNNGSIAIIGGAAAAVVIVLIGIIVVVMVILVVKSRRASYKLKDNKKRFGAYDDVNISANQGAKEEGLGGGAEYETMEMVSHDYETLEVYNKERETINTEDTQKQLAGAYDVTTCEAYGTAKTSISTPTDGYEVTQCPAYVTTASTEQRETSPQVREASAEGDVHLEERKQGQAEPTEEEETAYYI